MKDIQIGYERNLPVQNASNNTLRSYWQIMEGVRRFGGQVERALHPFCTTNNITSLQLGLLLSLYVKGPQTVSALAKSTCMAGANNSALCKKMEKEGFVLRTRDVQDERQVLVSLSPKGIDVIKKFDEECGRWQASFEMNFAEEEAQELTSALEKLVVLLERSREEVKK